MKSLRLTLAALATAAMTTAAGNALPGAIPGAMAQHSTAPIQLAQASLFGMSETSQAPFILVAQPTSRLGGRQRYGLMIIEQKKADPLCFSTTGANPTQVNVLLLNFDFSGICGKSTDTNGYLLRAAGEDIKYDPVLENEDGVLVLYASPRRSAGSGAERFIIGQTDGIAANGFTQISLKPGWRLARQTFNDANTGRTYIANDLTLAALTNQDVAVEPGGGDQSGGGGTPTPTPPTTPVTNSFPDVEGDIYANEINRAVQLGFISGFAEDNTFRPKATLTREQLVSIAIEGLERAPQGSVSSNPFPDVPASRWSAAKIKQAQDLGLVAGYGDGTFRPTQAVTRAELIAIMNKAALLKNNLSSINAPDPSASFSDIQGHWAESVINDLGGYCSIATPLNESGNVFAPDIAAQRNYAAAAMVRLLDCSPAAAAQ
ncbi:MAG: DUF3747 domain-containing protein [Cyanobacteria bacterium P01_D01_bin.105]